MQILIVEDDPSLGLVLSLGLRAYGHEVMLAATGADALRIAACGSVELILLDLGLPDMEGWEVLHGLTLQQRRETSVLIISVSAVQPRRIAEEALAGAIQKPFDMQTLLRAIERVKNSEAARQPLALWGMEAGHAGNPRSANG